MSVRVCLDEEKSRIVVECIGQVVRREAGWAAERVSELLRSQPVSGILIDANQVEEQNSPTLSSEMISSFLLAMESTAPIAYVRPARWTQAYYNRVLNAIQDSRAPHLAMFDEIDAATDWLRNAAAGNAITG